MNTIKPKKRKLRHKGKVSMTIYIGTDLIHRIDQYAASKQRSVSHVVRDILEEHLLDCEKSINSNTKEAIHEIKSGCGDVYKSPDDLFFKHKAPKKKSFSDWVLKIMFGE